VEILKSAYDVLLRGIIPSIKLVLTEHPSLVEEKCHGIPEMFYLISNPILAATPFHRQAISSVLPRYFSLTGQVFSHCPQTLLTHP
jgi:hypothetical protein